MIPGFNAESAESCCKWKGKKAGVKVKMGVAGLGRRTALYEHLLREKSTREIQEVSKENYSLKFTVSFHFLKV